MWGTKVVFIGLLLFYSVSNAMIYGDDNRRPITKEYAEKVGLRPIVYLFSKKPKGPTPCTGTWISETLILTARHCVANAPSILIINQFENYMGESRALAKRVFVDASSSDNQDDWYESYGSNPRKTGRPNARDWAVIEIYKEAGGEPATMINAAGMTAKNLQKYGDGSDNGFLKIADSRILEESPGIELAAFHGDADDALHREFCRYRPRDLRALYWLMNRPGVIEVDCDIADQASGAPLLKCDGKKCEIVGIVSGSYSAETDHLDNFDSKYGNMAVPSKNFMTVVNQIIRKDYSNVKTVNFPRKPKCKLSTCI